MITLSAIPSHMIAQWLLELVKKILGFVGLGDDAHAQEVLYVIVIISIALALGYGLRKVVLFITSRLPVFKQHRWGQRMTELHTLESCTHFIAPVVFLALVPFAFASGEKILVYFDRLVLSYLIVTLAVAVCAVLKLEWVVFNDIRNTKNLPLKGILNVCKGIVWIIAVILIAATLLNKSPMSLLAGLGALSAALLLIFRDSILGLVATLQLSSNDLIRVGDWVVVPGTPVNGTVLDVTLSAVKVKNWDNTTTMLSPYKLVSGSFQNYRGMIESGARRIESCIYVDPVTVVASTPELFADIAKKYPIMQKAVEVATSADGLALTQDPLQSGMATNLGLFRAYAYAYLRSHPRIAQDQDLLVNLQDETEFGVPVRFYCFSNITKWVVYEQIHDEVLEHFYSAAPDFGLSLCNFSNYNNAVTITGPTGAPMAPPALSAPTSAGK